MTAMSDDDRVDRIGTVEAGRWDLDALRAGAAICLVLAIPFTVLGLVVDAARTVSFFGALAGFVIGSGSAAWVQRSGTPLSHALVTAIGTYAAAQAVFIAVRLITGRTVNWSAVLVTLSMVSIAGVIGGVLGSRLQARGFVPSSRR
jgi:hypothetical protein